MNDYVHGYTGTEATRLVDQATTLSELLHYDTSFPEGDHILEVGCGVGGQTLFLCPRSPGAHFTAIDISLESIQKARTTICKSNITNVSFQVADIFHLPFSDESFDHLFICFVLEHLPDPKSALITLKRILKKNGAITVIEGDHGSYYCHPRSEEADLAVQCLIEIQVRLGGNSLIGRQLYPLLNEAGFREIRISPRMVYVDSSRPELVEGFTKKTFTAMVEGVEEQALAMNLIDKETWDKGIRDLYRAAEGDGTFCYTFFKGVAYKK